MVDDVVDQHELDAAKKNALPDSLTINDNFAPVDRAEYLKLEESAAELVKQYGLPNFTGFMVRIGSDGIFAQEVVRNLITGEKGLPIGVHPNSPQEADMEKLAVAGGVQPVVTE